MEDTTEVRIGSGAMASKFHRWWLGSCVAALLLASWAGGFSVAVTAVFVVVYLTGVTLVGPDADADIGLAAVAESPEKAEPGAAAVVEPRPISEPKPEVTPQEQDAADDDAEPYPDDAEPAGPTPADVEPVVVESRDAVDAAAVVVEAADAEDTAALVVHSGSDVDTTAVIEIADAGEPEPSPA